MAEYMSPLPSGLLQLLHEDLRYKLDAYLFIFQALDYARKLGMGREAPSEPLPEEVRAEAKALGINVEDVEEEEEPHRHISGQELCEAARLYAIEQYGYLAKTVLNSWGIYTTSDFGEIVYNLIRVGLMRKTREDRREDFDNVYDFEDVFCRNYQFVPPKPRDISR